MEITMIKNIDGFDGYLVDDLGNVYSKKRKKEIMMVPHQQKTGYLLIGLRKNKKSYYKLVHRLVAQVFIPNPENKREVNHKDGNPKNNCVSNLEWVSPAENINHSYKVLHRKGSMAGKYGKDNPFSKIVLQIKDNKVIAEYYGTNEAERQTGIFCTNIVRVCNGKQKHAGGYQWKYKDC